MERYLKDKGSTGDLWFFFKHFKDNKFIKISNKHNQIVEHSLNAVSLNLGIYLKSTEEEFNTHYAATLAYLGIPGTISKFQQNFIDKLTTKLGEPLELASQVQELRNIEQLFLEFWELYPKKDTITDRYLRTSKNQCKSLFLKYVTKDRKIYEIIKKTVEYLSAYTEGEGHKYMPSTFKFLTNKKWEDYEEQLKDWNNTNKEIDNMFNIKPYNKDEDD